MDSKDKPVIRGLVYALSTYCCATESLVVNVKLRDGGTENKDDGI